MYLCPLAYTDTIGQKNSVGKKRHVTHAAIKYINNINHFNKRNHQNFKNRFKGCPTLTEMNDPFYVIHYGKLGQEVKRFFFILQNFI